VILRIKKPPRGGFFLYKNFILLLIEQK